MDETWMNQWMQDQTMLDQVDDAVIEQPPAKRKLSVSKQSSKPLPSKTVRKTREAQPKQSNAKRKQSVSKQSSKPLPSQPARKTKEAQPEQPHASKTLPSQPERKIKEAPQKVVKRRYITEKKAAKLAAKKTTNTIVPALPGITLKVNKDPWLGAQVKIAARPVKVTPPVVAPQESNCERKTVKDLCKELYMDEPRAQIFLDISSHGLTYSDGKHMLFGEFLQHAWDVIGLKRITRENRNNNNHSNITFTSAYKTEKRKYRGKRRELVEIVQVEQDMTCLRFRMTVPEYECLMSTVICGTWKDTVRRLDMIPSSIAQAVYRTKLDFRAVFRNLSDDLHNNTMPSWISLGLNIQRVQQNAFLLQQSEGSAPSSTQQQQKYPGEPASSFSAQMTAMLKESRETELKRKNQKYPDSDEDEYDSSEESVTSSIASIGEKLCFGGEKGTTIEILPDTERVYNKSMKLGTCMNMNTFSSEDNNSYYYCYKPSYSESHIHPYTISLVVYEVALMLSYTMPEICRVTHRPTIGFATWTPVRNYHFLKEWMACSDSVVKAPTKEIPVELVNIGNLLVAMFSSSDMTAVKQGMKWDEGLCEDIRKLTELVQNTHTLLDMHRHRTRVKGRFRKFVIADEETTRRVTAQFFLRMGNSCENPDELPSSVSAPVIRDLAEYKLLLFDRKEVDPLDLKRSIDIIEKWFFRSNEVAMSPERSKLAHKEAENKWAIMFNDTYTYLLCDKHRLFDLTRYYNAYLPTSHASFTRNIDYPMYTHHVHAFYYGGRRGMLNCMKFMLKTFCKMSLDISNIKEERSLLPEVDDPVMGIYSLLGTILHRFTTRGGIWNYLVNPLNDTECLRFTTPKMATARHPTTLVKDAPKLIADMVDARDTNVVYGVREDVPTIYHALRALIVVYATHNITWKGIELLDEVFHAPRTGRLRFDVPLAWQLTEKLILISQKKGKYGYTDYSDVCDIPEDAIPKDVHPFPVHLVLYHLCACSEIPDKYAVEIFLSIGCATNSKTRAQQFPMYFTSPPPPSLDPCQNTNKKLTGKRKLEDMNGKLVDATRAIEVWYANEIKENGLPEPPGHYEALTSLIQFLEELSYYTIRCTKDQVIRHAKDIYKHQEYRGGAMPGMIPEIDASVILVNKKIPPRYPIDFDVAREEPLYCDNVFPIFPSGFSGIGEYAETEESVKIPSWGSEPRPFLGSHEDTVATIVNSPIRLVYGFDTAPVDDDFLTEPNTHMIPLDPRLFWGMKPIDNDLNEEKQTQQQPTSLPSPSADNSNLDQSPAGSPSPEHHTSSVENHPAMKKMRQSFFRAMNKENWTLRPKEALSFTTVISHVMTPTPNAEKLYHLFQ